MSARPPSPRATPTSPRAPVGWVKRSADPTQTTHGDGDIVCVGSSLALDPTYDPHPGPLPASAERESGHHPPPGNPQSSPVRVVTMGCRLNAYESEAMRRHAQAAGLDDTVIVNTCAVTAEAVRQAAQTIRRLRRERPDARIVVTGCAAQVEPGRFAGMAEVDAVIGNAEKMRAETFRALGVAGSPRVIVNDIMSVRETASAMIDGFGSRRARLHADPERLRPPLHVLHHSVRPRSVALGAGRRGGGAGAPPGGGGLPRDRADRGRHHRLRPRPAGAHASRRACPPHPAPCAGAQAAPAVVHRPGRGRQGAARRHRRGAAPDAASASLACSPATI